MFEFMAVNQRNALPWEENTYSRKKRYSVLFEYANAYQSDEIGEKEKKKGKREGERENEKRKKTAKERASNKQPCE